MLEIIINFIKINGSTLFKGIFSLLSAFAKMFLKPFLFSSKRPNSIIAPYFWASLSNIALFITIFMDIFLIFDFAYLGRKIPDPLMTFGTINALIVVLIGFSQSMIVIYNRGKDDGSEDSNGIK